MDELEKLVAELKDEINKEQEAETNKERIIEKLQEIGAELLRKYEIRVGDITIEPLRVEPYLFKDVTFEDKFMHWIKKSGEKYYGPKQRNRRGKLYIHSGYSGVDIVLSDSDDYAFSFLIKNSRITMNGKVIYPFLKQNGVAKILQENGVALDYDEVVLYKKSKSNDSIVFKTIRNGLTKIAERDDFNKQEQNKYNELLISSFIELKEHTSSQYDFETGYGEDRAVVEYLKDYKKAHHDISRDELDKLRKELYPNGSKTVFVNEFGK